MDRKYTVFGWQRSCFQNAEHFSNLPPLPPPDFIKINLFKGLSLKNEGAARGRQGGGRGRQGGGKSGGEFPAPCIQVLGISTKRQRQGLRRSGGGKDFFPARALLGTLKAGSAGCRAATASGKISSLTLSFYREGRRRLKSIKAESPVAGLSRGNLTCA
jgi:hypothetical protein